MMRAIIPAVAVLVLILLILGFGLLFTAMTGMVRARQVRVGPGWSERAWNVASRWVAKREARVRSHAPWTHYCEVDPHTGDYLIGIKQLYRGEVVDKVEIHRVPADDSGSRLEWEVTAILRASQCNLGLK